MKAGARQVCAFQITILSNGSKKPCLRFKKQFTAHAGMVCNIFKKHTLRMLAIMAGDGFHRAQFKFKLKLKLV